MVTIITTLIAITIILIVSFMPDYCLEDAINTDLMLCLAALLLLPGIYQIARIALTLLFY